MSVWYKMLYQLGITPWEEDPTTGAAAEQISALLDREEHDRQPPFGQALDLGCGSGVWSIQLAARGWQVTGVDIVSKAIRRARKRAQAAGVEARFVQGDVTALRAAGVESGFQFVVDFECFNHLNEAQREAVGREVRAVTVPDATMLMLVWAPGRRGPLPRGASRGDIEAAFPEWSVIHEEAYAAKSALPSWLKKVDLRFYRLRRSMPHRAPGRDPAPGRA
jgi:SAM-dependent methyltransferase